MTDFENGTGGELTATENANNTSMVAIGESRVAQEVQASMVIAKRFPRDETRAYERIMKACKRPNLAEHAQYVYPRGGQQVTGPSIRLAEVCAQNWGNLDFGITEIEQRHGESVMMAYCWDLETNSKQTKVFTVKHIRHTRSGSYPLSDPRDIYETTANQGARRVRACILGIIPGDIIDDAIRQCTATLSGQSKEPLSDRVRKMVAAFAEFGVSQEHIERRLGHGISATIEQELVMLRGLYQSIKDNMMDARSAFPMDDPADPGKSASDNLADRLDANKSSEPEPTSNRNTPIEPDPKPETDTVSETPPMSRAEMSAENLIEQLASAETQEQIDSITSTLNTIEKMLGPKLYSDVAGKITEALQRIEVQKTQGDLA